MPSYLVAFKINGDEKVFEVSSDSDHKARKNAERNLIQGQYSHLWTEVFDESLTERRPLHFWLAISKKVENYIKKGQLSNFISYIKQNKIIVNQHYVIENRQPILINIVQNDRTEFLRWVLAQKETNLHVKSSDGSNAFHHVCSYESIKLLKRAGLNIDETDNLSRTPLAKAIEEKKFDIGYSLKRAGAKATKLEINKLLILGIKKGCSLPILRELFAMGAHANALDDNENNLLHLSAEYNRVRLAKELIKRGVDSKGKNKMGYTPLHICVIKNNCTVAKLLLQKRKIVDVADKRGNTPIFYANNSSFINLLIKHGADINWRNVQKRTPIYYVKDKLVCRAMLRSGAKLDIHDIYGNLPIHLMTDKFVAKALMKAYGNNKQLLVALESKNQKGRTPLHTVMINKRFDVAEVLLKAGANPKETDNSNTSILKALFLLREGEDVCDLSSANNYNQTGISNTSLRSQEIIEGAQLIERFYPEFKDDLGNNLLHYASLHNELNVVKAFVGYLNHNLDSQNKMGSTSLHFAVEKNNSRIADYLLDSGANLDITDLNGYLPIHLAAMINSPEMLTCLLKHGSLIDKLDNSGKAAIEYIDKDDNNANRCFKILAENGADITKVENSIDKGLRDNIHRAQKLSRGKRIKPPYSTLNNEPKFGPKRQLRILINNQQPILNQLLLKHIGFNNMSKLNNSAITWEMLPNDQSVWGETLLEYLKQSEETCRAFSKRWPKESVQCKERADFRPTWDAIGTVTGVNKEIKGYILLTAVSSENDISKPAPGLAITNRLLIEKTWLDFGFKMYSHDKDIYFSSYNSSAEYRFIEREIVSKLLEDVLGVPVYPMLLSFYDDKTIISGSNSKKQLSNAFDKIFKEVEYLRNKSHNYTLQNSSIFIEAFPPPDWQEHQVCYLGSSSVCGKYKKKKQSLIKPAKDSLEKYRKVIKRTFDAGSKTITVESNVFVIPEPEYEDVVVRLKFQGVGEKRVEKVRNRMNQTIQDLYLCFESKEWLSDRDDLKDILVRLNMIKNSVTPDIVFLKEWDKVMDEISAMSHSIEQPILPLYYFIRPGFFLSRSINSSSGSLVAGCYVNDDSNNKRKTIIHELAHAAMETSMEKGAVADCRWIEEAFAEYFAQLESGFLPTKLSGCEGDVYMVWTTLADMKKNGNERELERLLEKVLCSNLPTDICPEVLMLKNGAEDYRRVKRYPGE